ncbi:MAG: YhdP family protein [Rhodocyclaceae bacterium]
MVCLAVPRALWRTLLIAYFIVGFTFLALRYVAMPQVGMHRDEIAATLSRSLGLRVEIAQLKAEWTGLRPELHIGGLRLFDRAGQPVLELPRVDATVAWSSLWRWQWVTKRLTLTGPQLAMRRDADGRIFVAGLQVNTGGPSSGEGFSRFVLGQERIEIRQAQLSWQDDLRAAPLLQLTALEARLDNRGARHRLAVRAAPPSRYAAPLDIRADLRGQSFSDLDQWRGAVYVALDRADLAAWRQWIDYPFELPQGKGGVHAWLNFEGHRVAGLTADVAVRDARLRLAPDLPELGLTSLSGRLRGAMREGETSFSAERLHLTTADGVSATPSRLSFRAMTATAQRGQRVELAADDVELAALHQLSAFVPLDDAHRLALAEAEPRGHVSKLSFDWQAAGADKVAQPMRFKVDARFENVAVRPRGAIPGIEGLSGSASGDERGGQYDLTINGQLHVPGEMQNPAIDLQRTTLRGQWSHRNVKGADTLVVGLREAHVRNDDAAGTLNGEWLATGGAGHIDLTGRFTHARAAAVWRYMPLSVPTSVTDWLRAGLLGGQVQDISLRLAGQLAHFPYRNDAQGTFRVQGRMHDAKLHFGNGWPGLDNVRGSLLFDRTRMLIQADSSNYGAARATARVEIPDLEDVGNQSLRVDGKASGPTKDFLDYVNASRLSDLSGHFSRQTTAIGNGELDLHLLIPLHDATHTQVKGGYRFVNNQVRLFPDMPEFRNVQSRLTFTEHAIAMPEMTADFLGAPLRATGTTDADGTLRFEGGVTMPVANLRGISNMTVWNYLTGKFDARVNVTVHKGSTELAITSPLVGVASALPAPFAKATAESLPVSFRWRTDRGAEEGGSSTQSWRLQVANRGEAAWEEECDARGCRFARGAAAVSDAATLPQRGLRLSGRFQRLDIDAWKPIVMAAAQEGAAMGAEISAGAVVQADELVAAGHVYRKVTGRVLRQDGRYLVRLEGPDIAGDLAWQGEGKGKVQARLSRLALHPLKGGDTAAGGGDESANQALPDVDIVADDFSVQDIPLGRLQVQAVNRGDEWRLGHISVEGDDHHLRGSGVWRPFGARRAMTLTFALDSDDTGKLLSRLGYPDSMRAGKTHMSGTVSWRGVPAAIDYASLSGEMALEVRDGQFSKLNPGAGRLLGVLSLQSLPRRLTLDFRDVFSEGFAFDTLQGNTAIRNGVMRTEDLHMRGPAARVNLSGSTDIAHETHDLKVVVQPTLSETVAVGAAAVTGIINPVVGVAAYVAQKVLRDPVEKIFSFEYAISGPWADPKVERILSERANSSSEIGAR